MLFAITHSYYSMQAGVRSPRELAQAAADRGYAGIAIADVNGLYGAVEACREAEKAGLQAVIGAYLELDNETFVNVLVPSENGYSEICTLISRMLVHGESGWRALATLAPKELLFFTNARATIWHLRPLVPEENVFILPRSGENTAKQGSLWETAAPSVTYAPLPEAWFIEEEDREVATYLENLRGLQNEATDVFWRTQGAMLPYASTWEAQYPEACQMSERILQHCRFSLTNRKARLPVLNRQDGRDSASVLRDYCMDALPKKYDYTEWRDQAESRLQEELRVITDKGFADYFLYVYEIIGFARRQNIPVEVRGSGASSIVAYLLDFTHCCPLENDLCFERFMNDGREDYPDIDVDIADNRRDEVINYCYQRWGEDRVAGVATIQHYRWKGALREATRLIENEDVTEERPDTEEAQNRLIRIAECFRGLPRHTSVHCGGLVITPGPVTDTAPLMRASKGVVVVQYEKDQAEAAGLVKLDLLGNTALSVIDQTLEEQPKQELLREEESESGVADVKRLFAEGDTLGIYQCESPGMRQLCQGIEPQDKKEVARALSLIRPGPASSGMKDRFIRRRRGVEAVNYLHPALKTFLASTYGVMLFQEDVMKVAIEVAGYPASDADRLRKALTKSGDAEWLREQRQRFIHEKGPSAGLQVDKARMLWDQISRFAGYAYCKAHASVYGRLAWINARLKTHYPCAFYAALLNLHKSMYPPRVFVWDAIRKGISVFPPDVNYSYNAWKPVQEGIQAGINLVKGLRAVLCRELVAERERNGPFRHLQDLLQRVRFHRGEIERLIIAGACRSIGEREKLLKESQITDKSGRQLGFFEPEVQDLPSLSECEQMFIGIPFTRHPVTYLPRGICKAVNMRRHVKENVTMIGIMDTCKETTTGRHGSRESGNANRRMSFATLEDITGMFEVLLFPDEHERYHEVFKHPGPYKVHGRVVEQWGALSLQLKKAQSL